MSLLQPKQTLYHALQQNGLEYSTAVAERLLEFLYLLRKWNSVINLTTITNFSDMIYLHLLDSLMVTPYICGKNVLDLGSGGGLPGIPLAIVDPARSLVLLDKNRKKTQFLFQVVAELGLKNVQVVCSKGEEFHYGSAFDTIITRAFGSIELFLNTVGHLGGSSSKFLAMKGLYPLAELAHLPPNFTLRDSYRLNIHGVTVTRHLLSFTKDN